MGDLAVVVSAGGLADGARDVLADLQALGLVDRFLWVSTRDVAQGDPAAEDVRDGLRRPTTLQSALATSGVDRVRLCFLLGVDADVRPATVAEEHAVVQAVRGATGEVSLEPLRLIVGEPGHSYPARDLARDGWHNLVLSPEDEPSPRQGRIALPGAEDAVTLGRRLAPVLAALLGLWSGEGGAPLDGVAPSGTTVRLVRAFHRSLSAISAEEALRAQVFDVSVGMPLPRVAGQAVVRIEESSLASRQLAEALWRKHGAILRGPRVQPQQQAAAAISPLAALRMLMGFLWAAVRNAPATWYRTTINRFASATAGAVQSAVFGTARSAYAVVVRGVAAGGLPPDWEQLVAAGAQIEDALDVAGRQQRQPDPVPDLSQLWKDYAAAALTLADAGRRSAELSPVEVGAARGVVREPGGIVPDPRSALGLGNGYVAASTQIDQVGACDVQGARDLDARLAYLSHDQSSTVHAERTRAELHAWVSRNRGTFAYQVGGPIADQLTRVAQELRGYLATIESLAAAPQVDAAAAARQKRLGRLIALLSAAALLLVVLFVVLGAAAVLPLFVGIAVSVVLAAGWLGSTFALFVKQQRALFSELNRRREAESQLTATQANLRAALRDQRRLAGAYRQYLAWSAVLGELLHRPFGVRRTRPSAAPDLRGLTMSTQIGEVVVDEASIAEVAATVRRSVYADGWLDTPFTALLEDAGTRLGPEGQELRGHPDLLYGLPAGPDGLLSRWSTLVIGEGVPAADGGTWDAVMTEHLAPGSALRARLVATVKVAGATPRTTSLDDFLGGIEFTEHDGETFDPRLLTSTAQVDGRDRVRTSRHASHEEGLSRTVTLTQLSDGIPAYELAGGEAVSGEQVLGEVAW